MCIYVFHTPTNYFTAAAASSPSTHLLHLHVYTSDLPCQGFPVLDVQFQTGLFSLHHKIG